MRRNKAVSIFVILISICGVSKVLANAGDLDPTFGGDGKVISELTSGTDSIMDIAIQPDGKILAAGTSFGDFAVARYNSDGTLDSAFGSGGVATADFDGFQDFGYAVALQQDGKIIVVGWAIVASAQDFGLVRFNSNGSLDTTFGTGGFVNTNFDTGNDSAYDVAIQSDGKIVVVGDVAIGGLFEFGIARYNSNGSLDGSFGTGGKVSNLPQGYASGVAVQSDGKIVAVGRIITGSDVDFAIARYNSNGSLDTTFNSTGEVITDLGGMDDNLEEVAIQSDGKIVVVGSSRPSSDWDFAVARYNSNGSLDSTFGSGGAVITDFTLQDDGAFSVAIDSNSKIVVAGLAVINGNPEDTAVVRYNSDGSLDSGFGTGGKVTFDYANSLDYAEALALHADGKIVVAGESAAPTYAFAIARLDGSSGPPPGCLFCDDFENAVLDMNWTYVKPSWIEASGYLTGQPTGAKAEVFATPVFSGCSICIVQTSIRTQGGVGNKIWFFAWYTNKQNTVELLMKEESDKWILRQRVGGSIVAKTKGSGTILPNVFYDVKIEFNGTNFILTVGGTVLATMPAAAVPNGTVGFRIKKTTGSFAFIQVD
jgi:uncharacterized delta-60 repeat protein